MTSPRILVLLCTYNERQNLPEVLSQVWQAVPSAEILVVDDNSPDGTGQWVSEQLPLESRLHYLPRAGKLGLGSALRSGMAWALDKDYDFLVNLDADLSHDPAVIPSLIDASHKNDSGSASKTVAIGSRYIPGGKTLGLGAVRQLLSRFLNTYATTLLGLAVKDCSGSFRCYPIELLRSLQLEDLRCNGYGFLEEILVALREKGTVFAEVPITYQSRGSGTSKLTLQDALGALAVIHRLTFRRTSSK